MPGPKSKKSTSPVVSLVSDAHGQKQVISINSVATIACCRMGFARIIQPLQLIQRRHPPVLITAPVIILTIELGILPIYITSVVLSCPHQVRFRVQYRPVVIGDETTVPDGFPCCSMLCCIGPATTSKNYYQKNHHNCRYHLS